MPDAWPQRKGNADLAPLCERDDFRQLTQEAE
jgi:hypothetical protein